MPRKIGIPIGNLTSQIFANIYLNEFDRLVVHTLKPLAYMRYGDDFLLFAPSESEAQRMRQAANDFLRGELHLSLHATNNIIVKVWHGIHFLGLEIFPHGHKLKERMWRKICSTLSLMNTASYTGLTLLHAGKKKLREIHWRSLALLSNSDTI